MRPPLPAHNTLTWKEAKYGVVPGPINASGFNTALGTSVWRFPSACSPDFATVKARTR